MPDPGTRVTDSVVNVPSTVSNCHGVSSEATSRCQHSASRFRHPSWADSCDWTQLIFFINYFGPHLTKQNPCVLKNTSYYHCRSGIFNFYSTCSKKIVVLYCIVLTLHQIKITQLVTRRITPFHVLLSLR